MLDVFNAEILIVNFVLVAARIGGFMAIAPVFSTELIPIQIKVWLTVLLAIVCLPVAHLSSNFQKITPVMLGFIGFKEVLIGGILGFTVLIIFSGIQFAATQIDEAMGLNSAVDIDPLLNIESSVIEQWVYAVSILIFLIIDGHHLLISGIYHSYAWVPIGHGAIHLPTILQWTHILSGAFISGFEIAFPIFAILFLANITLGILGRLIPQMNVFVLSFAVKILVGLVLLHGFLPTTLALFKYIYRSIPSALEKVLISIQ